MSTLMDSLRGKVKSSIDSIPDGSKTKKGGYTLDDKHAEFVGNNLIEDFEYRAAQYKDVIMNTPENRMGVFQNLYFDGLNEPTKLNFKLLIDWDKEYGLFADEKHVNSALAYFKRIGKIPGYEMLYDKCKLFIERFKEFIQYYDYLILEVEGMDEAWELNSTCKFPNTEAKLTFRIRETLDLRIQSFLQTYCELTWDSARMVEILPENLRMFDCAVVVFTSGYYNNFYDQQFSENAATRPEQVSLPTKRKLHVLNNTAFKDWNQVEFNYQSIHFYQCEIFKPDSGKSFFDSLTNEMEDSIVNNNLVLSYKFCNGDGKFKNIFDAEFIEFMMVNRIANQIANDSNASPEQKKSFWKRVGKFLGGYGKSFGKVGMQQIGYAKGVLNKVAGSLIGKTSPIGNALDTLTDPDALANKVGSAFNAGANMLVDKYVYANIAKMNKIITGNFNVDMLTEMTTEWVKKNIMGENKKHTALEIIKNKEVSYPDRKPVYIPEQISEQKIDKGFDTSITVENRNITYEQRNIYKPNTF